MDNSKGDFTMNTKKKNSAALKSLAREALIGRYGVMAGGGALIIAMNILSTFIPEWIFPGYTIFSQIGQFLISIVISLLVSLFSAGYTRLALDVSRGRRPLLGDMLHPFFHHPDRFLLTYLILVVIQVILQIPVTIASRMYANAFLQQTLTLDSAFSYLSFVLLCSSVSTLVYVILTLRFVMATYLLLDYDEIGGIQALKESSRMMRGQKGRYFYVTISFFGVMALSVLTCGIGMLWVMPYMETTLAFFYRDLAGEV